MTASLVTLRTETDAASSHARRDRKRLVMVGAFSSALFLSALLMFWLELMIGKMLLPRLGGAPVVWNTCLVFFQLTLLAAYGFVHGVCRFIGIRRYMFVYTAVVILACAALPVVIHGSHVDATEQPIEWLLLTLAASIGLPFFALGGTASGLQSWLTATAHDDASDPYFLYAASNAGSFTALLLYCFAVEPFMTLSAQTYMWAFGYLLFVALVVSCALLTWNQLPRFRMSDRQSEASSAVAAAVSWRQRLGWIGLALIPSSLLTGITAYISTDIAAVPLLWTIPLALYLLTFAVAFTPCSNPIVLRTTKRFPLLVCAVVPFLMPGLSAPIWLILPLHLGLFVAAALMCHGQLAAERPPAAALTEFYLAIAAGGVLGGAFNTFIAPYVFTTVAEYPLMLVAACAARIWVGNPLGPLGRHQDWWMDMGAAAGIGVVTATAVLMTDRFRLGPGSHVMMSALPVVLCFSQSQRPLRFAVATAAMLFAGSLSGNGYGRVLHAERTLFGVYDVTADPTGKLHSLVHGTTIHGAQWHEPGLSHEPLTYYSKQSPIGQAFEQLPQLSTTPHVAVVGLGAGSLAAYAQPRQRWTFYEIDPVVERIARTPAFFTYLPTCGDRCHVIIGDARVALSGAVSNHYGLIVLDAFSSDAIPIHLLTREALLQYVARLTPDGVLAFHISNHYLSLRPVLARLAENLELTGVAQSHVAGPEAMKAGLNSSEWVLLAKDRKYLLPLVDDRRWTPLVSSPDTPLWRDDFSNIVRVLKR